MFTVNGITFQVAKDQDVLHEIFRLRYRVYVEEYGFEKPSDHPGGIETDKYDRQSVHLAGICNKTGRVIATLRMVQHSHIGLPMTNIDEYSFNWEPSFLQTVIEVSRLTIDKQYRRANSGLIFDANTGRRESRPVAVFGLYRLLYHESKKRGVTHWAMISEPHLHGALTSMGFLFHQIGHMINYHGMRVPYIASLDEMERGWIASKSPTFQFLSMGLDKRLLPQAIPAQQRLAG